MTEIKAPYNVFFGEDGYPLEGGYIYIGEDGLNPLSNPQQAYWDAALTIPAAVGVRTSGGRPSNNGVVGRLYVPGDYSILVQDKHRKTVYSQLSVAFEYNDLLLTELRGALSRSARAPASFAIDSILESGFYAWTNGATTNQPPACAAGDVFILEVINAPDGTGSVFQRITDITKIPAVDGEPIYQFMRLSKDAGATWTSWRRLGAPVDVITTDKTYVADTFNNDRVIVINNPLAAAIDISAGAVVNGVRVTFIQKGAGASNVAFGTGQLFVLSNPGETQEFVWDATASEWFCTQISHGQKVFGPGTLAATTWRIPPGVRTLIVTACGQGGAGGTSNNVGKTGGGGGSGAFCNKYNWTGLKDGEELTVTLSVTGDSTLVTATSAKTLTLGKGNDAAINVAGAGGVGAGGATNGNAGGAGVTSNASIKTGGSGGGIGSAGAAAITSSVNIAGGAGAHEYIPDIVIGEGGYGAGSSGSSGGGANAGGDGVYGGGGGGGSTETTTPSFGAGGAGGLPFVRLEW